MRSSICLYPCTCILPATFADFKISSNFLLALDANADYTPPPGREAGVSTTAGAFPLRPRRSALPALCTAPHQQVGLRL